MAKKASFIVFYDWEDYLKKLTDEQMGQVFRAMFAYEKRGEAYTGGDPTVELAMEFLAGSMDRNRAKYEEICRKRSAAGKKGGAPEGNQNARKNLPKVENKQNKQNQAKQPDSDSERECEPKHEPEREYEPEREPERPGGAAGTVTVLQYFRDNIFPHPTRENQETIARYCEEMGCEQVMKAMRIAQKHGVKGWKYCEGILKNWKKEASQRVHGGGIDERSPDPGGWEERFARHILR